MNKSTDSTGYSWQTYDKDGNKIQDNSKSFEGEHIWYNVKTGQMGGHCANVTDAEKNEAGKYFSEQRLKK